MKSILAFLLLMTLPLPVIGQQMVLNPYIFASSTQPDNPLILHYVFSEGSGTSIADTSGNGYNGTLNGATWVTGKSGSGFALQFDGSNDYAQTATITFGANIITICAWVYWDAFSDNNDLLLELSPVTDSNDNTFFINPNSSSPASVVHPRIQSGSGGTALWRGETFTRWSPTTWTHLAFVLDNSTTAGDIKVYIDGVLTGTTIEINTKDQTGDFKTDVLNIMSRNGANLFAAGRVDDLRIYNGELTSTEVGLVKDDPQ